LIKKSITDFREVIGVRDEKLFDSIGREIIRILQEDARISFNELGRRVGLSSPAVAERVRRLEKAGIIKGYRAIIDPMKAGYSIMAFVRLNSSAAHLAQTDEIARSLPEVLEAHHLTGSDGVIIKVIVETVGELEAVVTKFAECGISTTSIALSSPITDRFIVPAVKK